MTSAEDIASKLAYVTGQLNARGTNAQMREWYTEYKKLKEELKAAEAMRTTTASTTATSTRTEGRRI